MSPQVTISQNPRKSNIFLPGPLRFGPTVP